MPINFDALVLAPCMGTFAEVITVHPVASIGKNAAPYSARGVYTERPIEVELADGTVFDTASKSIGVRLSEFGTAPIQGDIVLFRGARFTIDSIDDDGHGGTVWSLRELRS